MESLLGEWQAAGSLLRVMTCGFAMARTCAQMVENAFMGKPSQAKERIAQTADKAVQWFHACIAQAAQMGATAAQGQALLNLGKILAMLDRRDQAREALGQSSVLLERIAAHAYLAQAREQLARLQ